jgi:FkbH-like protein
LAQKCFSLVPQSLWTVSKSEHFAAKRINCQPKEVNIAEIARELNIGLDSLVFLDDNPVERAKVRAALPQVLTPEMPTDPAHYRRFLLELDVFDTLRLTEEDRKRNQMYAEQQARQAFEEKLGSSGSLDDYLAELQMVVEIEPANSLTLPRIAQLTGKTNQFNLTTRRYSEAQINEMQAQGVQVYGARVTDRFGDNGLTGVLIVKPKSDEVWEIDTLLLSCRVMGRGVETSLLAFLVEQAHRAGIAKIQGRFIPTAKNSPAEDCYRRHQFHELEHQEDNTTLWEIEVAEALTSLTTPTWLKVRRLEQVS